LSLRLLTFGRVQVFSQGREIRELPAQRLRCAILVYLLVERDVSREALLGLIWPDRTAQRARHALSQTLYELRRALGDEWLVLGGDRLRVQAGQVEVDTFLFEECAAADPEGALELYRGAFLADFTPDIPALEPWIERQRARLARLHRKVRREVLERRVAAGDVAAAQACARRWTELEPYDDEAHHRLIEALGAAGQRTEAIQHFDAYQRRLRDELEVEPLDETRALVATLREGASPAAAVDPAAEPAGTGSAEPPPRDGAAAVPAAARARLAALAPAPELLPSRSGGAHAGAAARGRPWSRRSPWLALPVVAGAILLWLGLRLHQPRPAEAPTVSLRSIAVLVFDDDSRDHRLGYLARGLTKHLIYELSQVPGLDVVSFNGVAPLAGKGIPPDSLRRLLNVGSYVDGSVQQEGDRLSVLVSLTDAASGRVLRTAKLKRTARDAVSLEDDLAAEVSKLLRQVLGQELALQEHRAHARNAAAWSLWLRADELRDQALAATAPAVRPSGVLVTPLLESADSLAGQAERRDDRWVEPLLLRGWLALDLAKADDARRLVWLRTGLRFANDALARAPELPRAYELRGTLRLAEARTGPGAAAALLDSAEADLRAAVVREPSLAGAWSTLSDLLESRGRFVEASQAAEEALRRDAFLQQGAEVVTRMYYGALTLERWDDAARWCRRGRRDYPAQWSLLDCPLTLLAMRPGKTPDPDSAWARLRTIQAQEPAGGRELGPPYRHVYRRMMVAIVLARAGLADSARALIAAAHARVGNDADMRVSLLYDEARVRLFLGERERTMALLREYLRVNPQLRGYMARDFSWRPLWEDPRFRALVADSGRAGAR